MGAEFEEDDIPMGSVCMDRHGSIGVVTHVNQSCGIRRTCGLPTYFGYVLDGGGHWQSNIPTKLADTLEEYKYKGPPPKPIAFEQDEDEPWK